MITKLLSITDARKLVGKKATIIQGGGGHGLSTGEKVTIVTAQGSPGSYTFNVDSSRGRRVVYMNEIRLLPTTIKELEEEMADLLKEIVALEEQIETVKLKTEFMKETKSEEFDETVFKSFGVLKTLEKEGITNLERAKIIASIVEN